MHYTLKYKAILTLTNNFEDFSPRSVGPIVLGLMAEQQTCHGPKLPNMWLEYKSDEETGVPHSLSKHVPSDLSITPSLKDSNGLPWYHRLGTSPLMNGSMVDNLNA